ncbi:Helix-turn-helix domain-containing protein [Butyrivibrio sp. ob235]|uniref:helix-turn-helix domain-containing protein n=1 Tax=Butyrivibrio sp. ob235 TaxID=1761780 RepID=UPI0008BF10E3|nr:helix-turn-helix transcriptional regulator [Butyrivibrio sp. ob235]SEL53647.1 Helix-turn-helix domain-containing protein [Butyrivibrio sp. ob235]
MKQKINTDRLKEMREQKGWNKLIASQEMGLLQSVYSRYEKGTRTPTYQVIRTMAQYLGTSAEYLTDQTDDPSPVEYLITGDDPKLSFIIENYSRLPEEPRNNIYKYVKDISSKYKK